MKLTALFSGSSGNCILLEESNTKILIDAGVSAKRILGALSELGIDNNKINALFITHEHTDHVAGAGVLCRKLGIPIFVNELTFKAMEPGLGKYSEDNIKIFKDDVDIDFQDICCHPFSSSHDAVDPVGYTFTNGKVTFGISTDLGIVTKNVSDNLIGCKCVLLEANHDVDMLLNGCYPMPLKKRILGEKGHLSNESAGIFAKTLIENGTQKICLGHLSVENNFPFTAFSTVNDILYTAGMKENTDYELKIAFRDEISESLE